MSRSASFGRTQQVARAAVEVLGIKGAAGLTHRAVDRQAKLPEGSTSNHFRTRAALVDAVCVFLTDHDLAELAAASKRLADAGSMTTATAAAALAEIIDIWTSRESVFTAARLELFLIAHRDPAVAAKMSKVRKTFRDRTVVWLNELSQGAGQHVGLVMAVVEGLTSNQLLHRSNRMSHDDLRAELQLVLSALAD